MYSGNGHSTKPPREQTSWYSRSGVTLSNPDGGESSVCHGVHCTFEEPRGGQTAWPVGGERVTWDELDELPTDPQALKTRLLGDSNGGEGILYNSIVNLLATAPTEPQLRAALFEVLASMDGVRLVGPMQDGEGRPGTAVEWRGPDWRHVLVVDPATSTVLEYKVKGPLAGAGWHVTTFLSVGPASKLG